jgi:eukaryotic-like serine/threonine-protein kinase
MNELDLFAAAIAIADPTERAALLDRECAGRSDLRQRLELLLAAHARSQPLLDAPGAGDPNATATHTPARSLIGAVIAGRYKLLEAIGEGGMGAVWMAEQREPVKRLVALKLIKPGMDSRSVLARFEAERQALALMDHPNIAKVLDGGTTAEGRPYFVMELIKGLPLTEYCDARRLSVRDRLELFGQVCSAVQHAHQKGVIHRDLKPTNVLVTEHDGKPVPKVIDFGLAKALNAASALTDKTLHTAFGSVVGTPLYMAPEQVGINALDVDTRTDIYALGVILYELLTGTTPLEKKRLREAASEEMRRLIREEEPPRPSVRLSSSEALPSLAAGRRIEPARLTKLVRGELDWIVMKALEKDRNRRYETANGLAMDVQRHLSGEPVRAVPPSAGYRLRKFARKNRAALTTAAAIALLLVVGVAVSTWQAVRATRAEQVAIVARQAEAERAEGERLAKLEAQANEKLAGERLVQVEAERKKADAAKVEAQAREAEANAVVKFFENKVFAAARPKGQDGGLGAGVTLRDAVAASVPALEKGFADQPLVEARLRHALGNTFHYLAEHDQARDQYERARALYTRHRGPDHPDTLRTMMGLANSYFSLNRHAEALKLYKETLAIQNRVLRPDHPDTLRSMNNLAASYAALNRHAEALKLRQETLAIQKRVLPKDHPETLGSMMNLANSYAALDRHAEALKLFEETLTIQKRVLPQDHPDTLKGMNNLANTYAALYRHADALKLHEETLAIQKRVLPPDHPNTLKSMHNLAISYAALNRHADALKLFEEVLAIRKRVLPKDHPDTLTSMVALAISMIQLDRDTEALPLLDEFLAKAPTRPAVNPRLIPDAFSLRGKHFQKIGDPASCRATAEMWEKLNRTDAGSLYAAACFRAVTAAVQAKTPGADAARLAKDDADRALQWLTKSVAAGYKDAAHMKKDTDLDFLRDRDDFKALLAELEAKSPPKTDTAVPPQEKK